jgi:hypothetical protein
MREPTPTILTADGQVLPLAGGPPSSFSSLRSSHELIWFRLACVWP